MATPLNKDLVRESTEVVNDKQLMVTICANQSIELKLKGDRSGGALSIGLTELYDYLGGDISKVKKEGVQSVPVKKSKANEKMISLYDLRSMSIIESTLTHGDRVKFDSIIVELIKSLK